MKNIQIMKLKQERLLVFVRAGEFVCVLVNTIRITNMLRLQWPHIIALLFDVESLLDHLAHKNFGYA